MGVQIVITMTPEGAVTVDGPLHNKVVMLGLLEIAKDLALRHKPEEASKIIRPVATMVPAGRG